MDLQKRILTIADIHGNGHLLVKLLETAHYSPEKDQLILLGDYINKGPDSIGTLEIVRSLCEEGAIALIGNNELKWLESNDIAAQEWAPFLATMPYWEQIDSFIFVHACLKKDVPIEEQLKEDITGINDMPIERYLNKVVVFGHTPTFRLGIDSGQIWLNKGLVGIDTGAGHGRTLSLVDLTNWCVFQINKTKETEIKCNPLDKRIVLNNWID